jgi:hypothetical protein
MFPHTGPRPFLLSLVALCCLPHSSWATPNITVQVDPASVTDSEKYQTDYDDCHHQAMSYDLSKEKAVAGASSAATVAGQTGTPGAKLFYAFFPAWLRGSQIMLGGLVGAGLVEAKETAGRQSLLGQCLESRGYRPTYKKTDPVYVPPATVAPTDVDAAPVTPVAPVAPVSPAAPAATTVTPTVESAAAAGTTTSPP